LPPASTDGNASLLDRFVWPAISDLNMDAACEKKRLGFIESTKNKFSFLATSSIFTAENALLSSKFLLRFTWQRPWAV
jgi:hypothetical protein